MVLVVKLESVMVLEVMVEVMLEVVLVIVSKTEKCVHIPAIGG